MTTNPNTPAPTPERDFAIREEVLTAAHGIVTSERTRVDEICLIWNGGRVCGQVVIPVSVGREKYLYTDEERDALMLAHLMQRHGWTRETIGDH